MAPAESFRSRSLKPVAQSVPPRKKKKAASSRTDRPAAPANVENTSPASVPPAAPLSGAPRGFLDQWGWLVVALLGALIFLPTLAYDFTYDDHIIIRENSRVRSLGDPSAYLGTSYWNRVGQNREYRPLTMLSYAISYAFHGARPFGYHLINIISHGLVCAAAWALARRLFNSAALATLAAGLFAIHPIHVEAVAGAVGRAEMQASLGFLTALLLALRSSEASDLARQWTLAAAAGLCAGLAVASKENAITILPMMAALPLFTNSQSAPRSLSTRVSSLAPALACSGVAVFIYLVARVSVLGGLGGPPGEATVSAFDNPLVELSPISRSMTAIKLLSRYAGMLLWPFAPSPDFSYGAFPIVQRVTDPGLFLGAAIGVAVLFGIWGMRRRAAFLFGGALFLITFLITSNIFFSIGTIMGERLLYLPSVGFCICVADLALNPPAAARRLFARLPAGRAVALAALGLWAISLTAQTFRYMPVWRNNRTLFAYMVERSPGSARAQLNYSQELMAEKKYDEAIVHLEKAVAIFPNVAASHAALAKAYLLTGRIEDARTQLERSLRIHPADPESNMVMSRVHALSGRRDLAEKLYPPVIDANPGIPVLKHDYALLLVENAATERNPEKAGRAVALIGEYLRDTHQRGEPVTLLALALAHEVANQPERARETLQRVLSLYPDNAEAKKRLERLESRKAPKP